MKQTYHQRLRRWRSEERRAKAPFIELRNAVRKIVKDATGLNAVKDYANGRGISGAGSWSAGYKIDIDTFDRRVTISFDEGSWKNEPDFMAVNVGKALEALRAVYGDRVLVAGDSLAVNA